MTTSECKVLARTRPRPGLTLKLAAAAILLSTGTYAAAGSYATGVGETLKEATENALSAAQAAVKSRKAGCVGPGKDGQEGVKYMGKTDGIFKVGAHYNHHNGSCGIKKSIGEYVKDLSAVAGVVAAQ